MKNSCTPFFSIVTVVLNDKTGFSSTFSSILNQECLDYEWIIQDGGSSDGTVELIKSINVSKTKWISEVDKGIYDAMNKGVAMSTGKYIVFMNAGDIFSTSSILKKVKQHLLINNNSDDVLFGGATLISSNGVRRFRPARNISYIWHGLPATHQATYYKRELLIENPYDLSYKICGDYYVIAILLKKGAKVTYMKEALADFMLGGLSLQSELAQIEAYKIQRDVIGVGIVRRSLSYAVRIVNKIIVQVLHMIPIAR